jgi:hypothetical protein
MTATHRITAMKLKEQQESNRTKDKSFYKRKEEKTKTRKECIEINTRYHCLLLFNHFVRLCFAFALFSDN